MMTSINVLHLDSERGYGGGQHQLKLLLQAGKEHGLSQAVACKHGSKIKSIAEHMGLQTIALKQRNDLDIASAHQLKKIISTLNPDIHPHTYA
jgi:hypothetical protein